MSGVGQHRLLRALLPATMAVLAAAALLLLAAGMMMEHHLGVLARSLAARVAPGAHAQQELDLALGDFVVASLLAADGDERILDESRGRLDAAAAGYDGWVRAMGLEELAPMEPLVHDFEEDVALAVSNGKRDERLLNAATDDVVRVLRQNVRLTSNDAMVKLREIAECQARRRWIEMALMALLGGGCLALLWTANRRERRTCAEEVATVRHLEEANADLEAFAGRVAHDLRNPLVPILSGSQTIERLPVDAQVKRAAERIERSARRLSSMIDMLLDFSRLTAASASTRASCEVAAVVADVAEGFRDRARAEGVRLEVTTQPVWAACEPIVLASPLQNLIENAFKYGRAPSGESVVEVRAFVRGGTVVVEVEDRGPGISVEEAEKLFRAFSRGVDGGEGVGLGLATARRLVESRGGSVALSTGAHGGALFQILLPVRMMQSWTATT